MKNVVTFTAGLLSLAPVLLAATPESVDVAGSTQLPGANYALTDDSIFAQGCMGSEEGHLGCMCPLLAALNFSGCMTLTPQPYVPQGHNAYEVNIQDWLFIFDDGEFEITGQGYYDRWTELDGSSWQLMTLDLSIYDELVQVSSGIVEDSTPGGAFPTVIDLVLESDTDCFGYVIALAAKRVPDISLSTTAQDGQHINTSDLD